MNKETQDDSMDEKDILEFLQQALGCTYISDLRTDEYRHRAKLIIDRMDIRGFSLTAIREVINYIFTDLEETDL